MSDKEIIGAAVAPTEAFNRGDWEKVREAITDDFVYDEVLTGRVTEGAEETLALWKGWRVACPDLDGEIITAFSGDGKVLTEIRWRATHTGPLSMPEGEIPATGRSVDFRSCQIWTVEGGICKSMVHYIDMVTMMRQLGLG